MPGKRKKTKFSPNQDYSATYTFPTRYNQDGEPIRVATITTSFSGNSILRYGLKNVIYHHAGRLKIPRGYSCVVDV